MLRILVSFFIASSVCAQPFIVEQAKPNAEIIVANQPTRSAKLAASELQTYLEKISGARLPIVTAPTDATLLKIFVGDSEYARRVGVDAAGLERDAFRMVSGPDWLALVGDDREFTPIEPWARSRTDWLKHKQAEWQTLAGHPWLNPVAASLFRDYNQKLDIWNLDHRGSLNAVYCLLRDLGVRWYMPGELGELVPKLGSIALPNVKRTMQPEFEIRSISRPLLSSQSLDDALWYLRIGANQQYGVLHHGMRNVTDAAEQRALHPEYYALLPNGSRDTKAAKASACLTSPGFFKEMVAYARLMFDHYDMPILSVMPEDGFKHCQCDQCKPQETLDRGPSGSSSDYVWSFVVRVANELAKTHPDRKVFCGAYSSYRLPPRTIDQMPDNVWLQITNGRPIRDLDDETHQTTAALRAEWQAKTGHPLSVTLNYGALGSDLAVTGQALALFDTAKAAAPSGSVHAQRIALVDEFLETMRDRDRQIAVNRPEGLPECRIINMATNKWQDVCDTLKMDGKLDEPFWSAYYHPQSLKDSQTGKKPTQATRFMARWWQDSLYFGIHCEGVPGSPPIIGGSDDGDPAIWNGEHFELLIETDKHSYYQIAIDAAGHIIDLDRGVAKPAWQDWSSQAEVVVHRDDGSWSAEIRLPVTSSDEDPLNKVVGSMPFKSRHADLRSGKGSNLPWHFNLWRKRSGSDGEEISVFSPLDPETKNPHDTLRFAELYVR